jgi:VIT1/CCC1 family predicted Fe2+/Mn2+ transporter
MTTTQSAAATPLGEAVRNVEIPRGKRSPRHVERHRGKNSLRDVILGGQDGLVNILGVIAGGGSDTVLLTTGFAAAITESISMGAVGYTSSLSERDDYRAEREREEIDTTPEAERREARAIYAAKGFTGDLLERVVDTITANRGSWLDTMMELGRHHHRHVSRSPHTAGTGA